MAIPLELEQVAAQRLPETPHFPHPENEIQRLATLLEYDVLDSLPEQQFDDLTAIAAHICDAPIALVSLLDGDRQWFKSHHGIDATETPREQAFCAHAIMEPEEVFIVPDAAKDERFQNNPLVQYDPKIRFYAGAPLVNPDGMPLGTLCVIDQSPREFTSQQEEALQALSRQVVAQLELRRQTRQLQQETRDLQTALHDLKKTQASLIQSEKMSAVGKLTAGMAHEMNNPLTFIQGNLPHCQDQMMQLLELVKLYRSDSSPEAIATFIEEIELDYLREDLPELFGSMANGVKRVKFVIEALQTFSQHDKAGLKWINLQESLDAVCELLNYQFQSQGSQPEIQLVKQYEDSPAILCVPGQLNQALMHLLNNAIEAVRRGVGAAHSSQTPQVRLSTQVTHGDQIQIHITDNGEGIIPEEQLRIFEPFYTTKPVGSGLGMGLAIAYQIIVKEHNGTLTCRSQVGEGTTMVITLPIAGPGQ